MKRLLILLTALSAICGCARYDIDEILLEKTEISLSWKGNSIYTHDINKGQTGFNAEKNEYRASLDDISSWFLIKWNARPTSEGQRITADVEWASKTSFHKEKDVEFEVRQINSEGTIWLWSSTEKIGVVIKDI